MYAIVEIAGQQFKVEEGKKIFVHRLENQEGSRVGFDRVFLFEDGESVLVGEPTLNDFVVEGKVLGHVKGDKVIVFKKKRKKGYRIKNGHRQSFTQIEITGIGERETLKKREPEAEPAILAKAEVSETVETIEEPVKEKKSVVKKAAVKKQTEKKEVKEEAKKEVKKPAAKKSAVKKPAAKKTSKSKE